MMHIKAESASALESRENTPTYFRTCRTTAMQSLFLKRGLINLFDYWAYRCPTFSSSKGIGKIHKINMHLEINQHIEH